MAKRDDASSNSDGLEIISIGTLYAGPWDKKYWSSSRGKDRYPYPIGYQALRTHRGITYKMEIHEGPKGPMFQITSDDKNSGSGETPDRAWNSFQKNCSSRVKLWHGKRFSGKADGVEFFGFKNALVQRLLRELVATINDAPDNAPLSTNLNNVSAAIQDVDLPLMDDNPKLVSYVEKTKVTRKRSRTCRGVDTNSISKRTPRMLQPLNQADIVPDRSCTPSHCNIDEPLISCAASDHYDVIADGLLPVSYLPELGNETSLSGHDLPVKSLDIVDDSKPFVVERGLELATTGTCSVDSLHDVNVPQEEQSILVVAQLDRQCIEVQKLGFCEATEERNEAAAPTPDMLDLGPSVSKDSHVNQFSDLHAPDPSVSQAETIHLPDSSRSKGEYGIPRSDLVADMIISEQPNTRLYSGEGSQCMNSNSENSDFDSDGEDITRTMLELLLPNPRGVPLKTYSSRKKKRKAKPSKELVSEITSDKKPNGILNSADIISPVGVHTNPSTGGENNGHSSGVYSNAAGAMLENRSYIVPDSLDDDQFDDAGANKISLTSNFIGRTAIGFPESYEPHGKNSSFSSQAAELPYCDRETNKCKQAVSAEESPMDVEMKSHKGCTLAPHATTGCTSAIPPNLLVAAKDPCPSDANLEYFEHTSKKIELQTSPGSDDKSPSECTGLTTESVSKKHSLCGNKVQEMGDYGVLNSESKICRNNRVKYHPEMVHGVTNFVSLDSSHLNSLGDSAGTKSLSGAGGKLERQSSQTLTVNVQVDLAENSNLHSLPEQALRCGYDKNAAESVNVIHGKLERQASEMKDSIRDQKHESTCHSPHQGRGVVQICEPCTMETKDITYPENQMCCDEIEGNMKLIGCYSHPMQISSVIVTKRAQEIYICVSCGSTEQRKRDLFVYKLSTKEPNTGRPLMLGYTPICWPSLTDEFGKEVAVDKSGIQFTPDARFLILTDTIRMPYCSEKNLQCSCPQCESPCIEDNGIKILQIKDGYAVLILKLNTFYPAHCILVCEPRLVSLDESGRIYIWIMDSTWSRIEEYEILSYDLLPSRIIELKKVPKSNNMVIGHNGYGEFSLWDLVKRTVVSRFSAPASSVLDFLPISLFSWQNGCLSRDRFVKEESVDKLLEEYKRWFAVPKEVNLPCQTKAEDIALCVVIYTFPDNSIKSAPFSSDYHRNSDGCWRLGLLVKNTVIVGAALPASTATVRTSGGIGIIGTHNGGAHTWDLATGNRLGTLHNIEGKAVSHVAVDESTSSVVAIAHDGGQLWVYVQR